MTCKQISRKLAAGLIALVLPLTAAPVQALKTTYQDVDDGAWWSDAVAFCQQRELMDGESGSSFAPDGDLTRAVLTEALYRLEGSPQTEAEDGLPFPDVGEDHPNLAAIRWAKETGVVGGYDNGNFGPEDSITREQIVRLFWNARGQEKAPAVIEYADRGDIASWATEAADWAYSVKLMRGTPENCFVPKSDASRMEGAALIMNYAKEFYGMKSGYDLPEPQEIPANHYNPELFVLDENGYLSYYGGLPCYRGLDVSAHQKEIDWARVAASGMSFAMIRAGYRGYTQGTIVKDEYFDANIRGALNNGMQVGVYFFSQALTPKEAEEEARQVLEWIQGYHVTYPVVFDWEEQDKDGSRTRNTDGNTVTACALAFCKVIEDAGYLPMTYGSPRKVYSGGLSLGHLQNYPFWLAHYTVDTAPTSFRYRYQMWQYSSTGHVDGIEGNVDLNICLADWYSWQNYGYPWWM